MAANLKSGDFITGLRSRMHSCSRSGISRFDWCSGSESYFPSEVLPLYVEWEVLRQWPLVRE